MTNKIAANKPSNIVNHKEKSSVTMMNSIAFVCDHITLTILNVFSRLSMQPNRAVALSIHCSITVIVLDQTGDNISITIDLIIFIYHNSGNYSTKSQ